MRKIYHVNIITTIKAFDLNKLEDSTHREYITTVIGTRIEIDGSCWFLWADNFLVTSGSLRDLHAVYNDKYGAEFDFTPVYYI